MYIYVKNESSARNDNALLMRVASLCREYTSLQLYIYIQICIYVYI